MTIGIYQILNLKNNKRYIGSSVRVETRLRQHKNFLITNRHCNHYLQSAWNKYGEDSFEIKLILICAKEYLTFYEDLIVKGFNSTSSDFGYNLRDVGEIVIRDQKDFGKKLSQTKFKHRQQYRTQKYNRLTLIDEHSFDRFGRVLWSAVCDCGTEIVVDLSNVRSGHSSSCGCSRRKPEKPYSRYREIY